MLHFSHAYLARMTHVVISTGARWAGTGDVRKIGDSMR